MFETKTVFVVGAGASKELGLPLGSELTARIAEKLRLTPTRDGVGELPALDMDVRESIFLHLANPKANLSQTDIEAACESIIAAMPGVASIDSYIDQQGRPAIAYCGKLAIAVAILEAERQTGIVFRNQAVFEEPRFDLNLLQGTWYQRLIQLIVDGSSSDDPRRALENLAFVVFNYDRCIETVLRQMLATFFRTAHREALDIVEKLPIFHPYGTVGIMANHRDFVEFGDDYGHHRSYNDLLSGMRTYTERHTDDGMLKTIKSAIRDAETLVFLGFGFHPQNMDLLTPDSPIAARRIFGTGLGMSKSDIHSVKATIRRQFRPSTTVEPYIDPLSCVDLFNEYWRTLSRQPS